MPFADVSGAQLHYRFDGRADAPVLMLSNSLGTNLEMWAPQIDALAARYRVLRYDSRGHGQSAVTPGPYDIPLLARDALGLLDALRVDRAMFCGLSMGGMVGQWLGANVPHRLARLVLANTAGQIGTADVWNARIDAVAHGGMAAIAEAVIGRWYTPAFVAADPAAIERTRRMLLASPAMGYIASCAAVRDMDQRASAGRIAVPTLVISGADDPATPPSAGRFLAENIPGARYVELAASHLSNVEAAAAFTAAVTEFLDA